MVVVDQHGIVRAFSHGAEELFGFAEQEVVGRNVRMLTPANITSHQDGDSDAFARTGIRMSSAPIASNWRVTVQDTSSRSN